MTGPTPQICRDPGFYNRSSCRDATPVPSVGTETFSARSVDLQDYLLGIDSEEDLDQLMVLPPARQ